jgi:hypothetical protein
VDPAERLKLFQIFVVRQHRWQVNGLVSAPLRWHHDTTDFFHLKVKLKTLMNFKNKFKNLHMKHVLRGKLDIK